MLGRVLLLWVNKKVRAIPSPPLNLYYEVHHNALDWRALRRLHLRRAHDRAGDSCLARSLAHRWRSGSISRRALPWSHLPHRHEPFRTHPTAMACHRLHRMDHRVWHGGLRVLAIHDGSDGKQAWYQDFAALVRFLLQSGHMER